MSKHDFQMRLNCTYIDPDNTVDSLDVETYIDNEWQALDLHTKTAGFQVFIYAILTCQHMYFRMNAVERGLMLASSKGSVIVNADEQWNIELLHVQFDGHLKNGTASQDAIEYIAERMGLCPVSCNLREIANTKTIVTFE